VIEIDGSRGEGGGQILRSALALSLVTGEPFSIAHIRAKRRRRGLLRQHLTAVRAATAVGDAEVVGDELGSELLTFAPRGLRGGSFRFDVGSAGSASLVAQTVLPGLFEAEEPSELVVEGGTHNPLAPPFEFLKDSYLSILTGMGARVDARLERAGFYPKGGGRIRLEVEPSHFGRLDLTEPGALTRRRAVCTLARLPQHVADRELDTLRSELALQEDELEVERPPDDEGPGNALRLELEHAWVTLVFTSFGEKGLPAEQVAHALAREVRHFQRAKVAVDAHLADQLLLPMALGDGGRFTTVAPTEHARTHAEIIRLFLERETRFEELGRDRWLVTM
jgi:RNA 3'-terminal phosphate cyclase (ATP)